jgi:hypothetical protein
MAGRVNGLLSTGYSSNAYDGASAAETNNSEFEKSKFQVLFRSNFY